MKSLVKSFSLTAISVLASMGPSMAAQQADAPDSRRLVEPSDYGQFERLEEPVLSPDGRFVAAPVARVDGSRFISLYDLNTSAEPVTLEQADEATFSQDSRWLAFAIVPTEREVTALEKEKKPVRRRAQLRSLGTGDNEPVELGEVSRFAFGGDGAFFAAYGYPASRQNDGGDGEDGDNEDGDNDERSTAELVVRVLASGKSAAFAGIAEFAWQDEGDGSFLALVVQTSGTAHAVELYNPGASTLRVLSSGMEPYSGLSWRDDSDDLAVLRGENAEGFEAPAHTLLAWKGLDGETTEYSFGDSDVEEFPAGMRIVEHRRPFWSLAGDRVFLGIAERRANDELEEETSAADAETVTEDDDEVAEEPADVEVWHSSDERIVAMQRVRKQDDRKANLLAAWNFDTRRFTRIGTDVHETVDVLEGGLYAVETKRAAYRFDNMFDRPRHDLVLVDAASGERRSIANGVRYGVEGSATGNYVLFFYEDHYVVYDIEADTTRNLTRNIPSSFVDAEYDTPVRQGKPPWGSGGWTEQDEYVLLYDRYDIWAVSPKSAEATRLTDGVRDSIRHRTVTLDEEAKGFDAARPIYVSLYGEWTKNSGFGRLRVGAAGVERLVYRDKRLHTLAKAERGELYTFVEESVEDSPDVVVGGATFEDAHVLTSTNTFQHDFLWTRGELIDYESAWGKKLQGALFYPADYKPGRVYPMIVYVYERLSQNLHRYNVPSERRYYNPAVWTQQGYFVLNPDIAYRDRNPGPSAVDCVVPAVEAVLEKGLVDRSKIGLVGHSWGGYEASFIPTQTDLFAAAVAGAPLTNFFSMFGTIHWSRGYPETSHFETGQARMEVPYWEDLDAYVRNSPVMFIRDLTTPMLVFFGDEDGTVDFHQGVELYNYARRAGKHLVMLLYRGEDHGARQRKNQVDYHRRILRWFGHFLKDEAAEDWITNGQTLLEREREIEKHSGAPK